MKIKKSQMVAIIILIISTTGLLKATAPLPAPITVNAKETLSVAELNEKCYFACREDLLAITALVENFYEEPYFCGKRWTIGYGTTVYPDGAEVRKDDPKISKEYAKECVYKHYDEQVLPWIKTYVKRELTKPQMLGVCSFLYNIGGENFTGRTLEGEKFAEPSNLLKAINRGESSRNTAIKMNGFRKSRGILAKGLPKRHWLEGAIYMGLIDIKDVYSMQPYRLYKPSLSFYYTNQKGPYWTHDYSAKKIKQFLENNISDSIRVRDII